MKKIKFSILLMAVFSIASLVGCQEAVSSSSSSSSSSFSSSSSSTLEEEPAYKFLHNEEQSIKLPFVSLNEKLSYQGSLSDTLALSFLYKSQENLSLKMKVTFKEETVTIKDYQKTAEGYLFSFGTIDINELSNVVKVEIINGEQTLTSGECSYSTYIEAIKNLKQEELGYEKLDYLAYRSLLVSFINYVNINSNSQFTLTDEDKALIYNSRNENYYHVNWGERDSLTLEGTAQEGFAWKTAVMQNNSLKFTFSLTEELVDLSSHITINGKEETYPVFKENEQNEEDKINYYFTTNELSPVEFNSKISVSIYQNNEKISSTATYSLLRAIAHSDIYGDEKEKELANALYSYGKAATWFKNKDQAVYSYLPPINDNGIYTLEIDEYTYDDSRMLVNKSLSTFGAYLYVNGIAIDSNHPTYDTEEVKVNYENGVFKLALNNASVDGILVKENVPLEIELTGDSEIKGTLYRSWDDKNKKISGSIISDGKVTLTSKNHSKLLINGSLYSGDDLSLQNINVEIKTSYAASNGVTVGKNLSLTNNSDLKVNYSSAVPSSANGVDVGENINIDNSSLQTKDFNNGLFLKGSSLTIDNDSHLSLIGKGYGITSSETNKELSFNNGKIYIEGNTGVNYCNVTVDQAKVEIVANNGFTIERHDGIKQSFKTISKDYQKGEVHLINKTPYNQYWDVNYTLCVDEMNIDGGTLYLEGNSVNGVIYTTKGLAMNLKNCDMYIKNNSFGHGINASSYNETLTIDSTSRLFVQNCDIAIGCWLSDTETDEVIKVYIYGDFAVDGYKGAIGEWDDHTKIMEGSIRYSNRVS